jgi:serine/threonine protein kinase
MIGKTISHYRIVEKLGGGGMGVVYEAEDPKPCRHLAYFPREASSRAFSGMQTHRVSRFPICGCLLPLSGHLSKLSSHRNG